MDHSASWVAAVAVTRHTCADATRDVVPAHRLLAISSEIASTQIFAIRDAIWLTGVHTCAPGRNAQSRRRRRVSRHSLANDAIPKSRLPALRLLVIYLEIAMASATSDGRGSPTADGYAFSCGFRGVGWV